MKYTMYKSKALGAWQRLERCHSSGDGYAYKRSIPKRCILHSHACQNTANVNMKNGNRVDITISDGMIKWMNIKLFKMSM